MLLFRSHAVVHKILIMRVPNFYLVLDEILARKPKATAACNSDLCHSTIVYKGHDIVLLHSKFANYPKITAIYNSLKSS